MAAEKIIEILNGLVLVPASIGVVVVATPEGCAHRFLATSHLYLVDDTEGRTAVALAGIDPVSVPKSAFRQTTTPEQTRRGTCLPGG